MRLILLCFAVLAGVLFAPGLPHAATTLNYDYDANGSMTSGDGKYFEYNDANQLVRVRHGDASGPVIAEYVYDYNGQRIKKVENGVTTYYVGKHFEQEVAGERQEKTSYWFANGERVAKKDMSGRLVYYNGDHLGGTNIVTDSDGVMLERIIYFPFGEIRNNGMEKYSYTGKEKDNQSTLYYYESRYYDSNSKHFTQADAIVKNTYNPQNLNHYTYVNNNPMTNYDPTGHFSISNFFKWLFGNKHRQSDNNSNANNNQATQADNQSSNNQINSETNRSYKYEKYKVGEQVADGECTQYAKDITNHKGQLGTTYKQKQSLVNSSSHGYIYNPGEVRNGKLVDEGDILVIDMDNYMIVNGKSEEIGHVVVVERVDIKRGVIVVTDQNSNGKYNGVSKGREIPIDSTRIYGGYNTDFE